MPGQKGERVIRYGKILADAWRLTWRSWAMWGWLAIGYGVSLLAMLPMIGLFAYSSGAGTQPSEEILIAAFAGFAVATVCSVLMYMLYNGALVHLSNEGLEGRPVRFGDGWRAGLRFLPRVAGLDLSIGLVGMVLAGAAFGVLGGIAAVMDSGSNAAAGGAFVFFCCGYIAILAIGSVFVLLAMSFEAIAVRAIVISGTDIRGGMASSRDVLRHRFKQVFVMGLILIGVYYGVQMVTSMLLVPFQFGMMASMPDPASAADPAAFFESFGLYWIVAILLSYAVFMPLMVFIHYVWTGFYRQLFGIDAPAELAAPTAPTAPFAPQPAPDLDQYIPAPPAPPMVAPPPAPPAPDAPPAYPMSPEE
ncbi:MAG: hypothetical protein Q8K89_12025 [Actinomycetota bacterium]|nr:hypothetical protein [Actinomycetota bacterium]